MRNSNLSSVNINVSTSKKGSHLASTNRERFKLPTLDCEALEKAAKKRTATRLESVGTMASTTPVGLEGPSAGSITEMRHTNLDCDD